MRKPSRNMKMTKRIKEMEKKPLTKCTVEKLKFVLICPSCKKKLLIFKNPPIEGMHVTAGIFKPYSKEVPKPIDFEPALCCYCGSGLRFEKQFTIRE